MSAERPLPEVIADLAVSLSDLLGEGAVISDADRRRRYAGDVYSEGGLPDLDWLRGAQLCSSAWEILSGAVRPASKVIVYDGSGRHPGATAAEYCHDAGSRVAFVTVDEMPVEELEYGERVIWRRELTRRGLMPLTEHELIEVVRADGGLEAVFESLLQLACEAVIVQCKHTLDLVFIERPDNRAAAISQGQESQRPRRHETLPGCCLVFVLCFDSADNRFLLIRRAVHLDTHQLTNT